MVTQADGDSFVQYFEAIHQRAQSLYESTKIKDWRQPQVVLTCIEELHLALEELQVAEEELRQQNDHLISAQETIEVERRRYQELFEFAPGGYLITDIYGKILQANQAALQLFNLDCPSLLRKVLATLVVEEQRRSFRTVLNQLPTIHRVQEWEIQLYRRQEQEPEQYFEAALTVETVRDLCNQTVALRWLIRDITARKQSETQLHQAQLQNLELIEADRLKSQFLGLISHELRTPLTAVLGFADLLRSPYSEALTSTQADMVDRIQRNGTHLLNLVEEILTFASLQSRQMKLQVAPFDLVELAQATVEELRPLALQKGLTLQVQSAPPSLPVVNDPQRLRQILTNLLSNALKFTEMGCVILEIGEVPGDRVILLCRDTGIGIDLDSQAEIFKEFWQVDQGNSRNYGGTGLGLAISRALVDRMQGSIGVESQLGKGTTFRVELPCQVTSG